MSEQESFWRGEFGDSYTERNSRIDQHQSNLFFWSKIISLAGPLHNVLELGCNRGLNLDAIKILSPNTTTFGVEINQQAADKAAQSHQVFNKSLGDNISGLPVADLTFTSGVLIHINPDMLPVVYDKLYSYSSKYIMIKEYFSTQPQEITYRGHESRLWKRDFASELWKDRNLKLIDYGFCWRYDPVAPQDDLNWFLFEKLE